jgi:hypothetical protein
MQWAKKGQPGPRKARVHATRSKMMGLLFFDVNGIIYMDYVLKGLTIKAVHEKKALAGFLVVLRQKRPIILSQEWILH